MVPVRAPRMVSSSTAITVVPPTVLVRVKNQEAGAGVEARGVQVLQDPADRGLRRQGPPLPRAQGPGSAGSRSPSGCDIPPAPSRPGTGPRPGGGARPTGPADLPRPPGPPSGAGATGRSWPMTTRRRDPAGDGADWTPSSSPPGLRRTRTNTPDPPGDRTTGRRLCRPPGWADGVIFHHGQWSYPFFLAVRHRSSCTGRTGAGSMVAPLLGLRFFRTPWRTPQRTSW